MICSHYIDVYQRKNENNKIVDWDAEIDWDAEKKIERIKDST